MVRNKDYKTRDIGLVT